MPKVEISYNLVTGAKNPTLRTKCKPVDKITKDVKDFCKILHNKMYEYEGVGLAAPQIGRLERIISVTNWKEKGDTMIITGDEIMINPEIISRSDEMTIFEEACLSLPGKKGDVARHREIKVSYMTPDGKKHTKKASNMAAIVIQHEIDHLDGVLFIDKLVD